jgi:hypothetical protein
MSGVMPVLPCPFLFVFGVFCPFRPVLPCVTLHFLSHFLSEVLLISSRFLTSGVVSGFLGDALVLSGRLSVVGVWAMSGVLSVLPVPIPFSVRLFPFLLVLPVAIHPPRSQFHSYAFRSFPCLSVRFLPSGVVSGCLGGAWVESGRLSVVGVWEMSEVMFAFPFPLPVSLLFAPYLHSLPFAIPQFLSQGFSAVPFISFPCLSCPSFWGGVWVSGRCLVVPGRLGVVPNHQTVSGRCLGGVWGGVWGGEWGFVGGVSGGVCTVSGAVSGVACGVLSGRCLGRSLGGVWADRVCAVSEGDSPPQPGGGQNLSGTPASLLFKKASYGTEVLAPPNLGVAKTFPGHLHPCFS